MKAIVAPYEVSDIDTKECRIIECMGVSEMSDGYFLEFTGERSFKKAVDLLQPITIDKLYPEEHEIKIKKDSLIGVLI